MINLDSSTYTLDSKIICKFCGKEIGIIKTPHGLITHSTCDSCKPIQDKLLGVKPTKTV